MRKSYRIVQWRARPFARVSWKSRTVQDSFRRSTGGKDVEAQPSGANSGFPTWCWRGPPRPTKSDCAGSRNGSARSSGARRLRFWMTRPRNSGQRRGGSDRRPRLSRSTYPTTSTVLPPRLLDATKGRAKRSQAWMLVVSTFRVGSAFCVAPYTNLQLRLHRPREDENVQVFFRFSPFRPRQDSAENRPLKGVARGASVAAQQGGQSQ